MKTIILFFTISLSLVKSNLICPDSSSGSSRSDCGYYGIAQNECLNKGCCWQPTSDNSAYCTYPNIEPTVNYYTPYLNSTTNPFLYSSRLPDLKNKSSSLLTQIFFC